MSGNSYFFYYHYFKYIFIFVISSGVAFIFLKISFSDGKLTL